jgi:signal transduction histidine kinase
MADRQEAEPLSSGLAGYLESRRDEILATYGARLKVGHKLLLADRNAYMQALAHAEEVLDEVADALSSGHEVPSEAPMRLARSIGESRAAHGVRPAEMIRAAAELFEIIMREAATYVTAESETLALAAVALNQSMSPRIREAVQSYYGFLLDKLHQAQTEERRHLARDLHDRVSADVSVAYRQLELCQMLQATDPAAADKRAQAAQLQVVRAIADIRQLTADLRLSEPIQGLEKDLRSFLESAASESIATEVIVNGNEAWLAPESRDDAFLAIREAVRNALRHSRARAILVRIDIAPHELRAAIDDDGIGFDSAVRSAAGGQGIASMTERVTLLGGTIRLSSVVSKGTKVEIHIPRLDTAKTDR